VVAGQLVQLAPQQNVLRATIRVQQRNLRRVARILFTHDLGVRQQSGARAERKSGTLQMARASWYMGVMPVPPATMEICFTCIGLAFTAIRLTVANGCCVSATRRVPIGPRGKKAESKAKKSTLGRGR
jgi:hypothetical protein